MRISTRTHLCECDAFSTSAYVGSGSAVLPSGLARLRVEGVGEATLARQNARRLGECALRLYRASSGPRGGGGRKSGFAMSKARRWCHAENFFRRSRVFAVADVVAGGGLWLAIGPPHLVVAVVARPRLTGGIVADPGSSSGRGGGSKAGAWVRPDRPSRHSFSARVMESAKFFCADASDRVTGESCNINHLARCNAGSRKQTGNPGTLGTLSLTH